MRIDKKEPEEENADHGGVRTVTALHKVADYRMIALRTEPPTAPTF